MAAYELTDEQRYAVVFGLKRAVASFREEHDRTDNPRAKVHADKIQEALDTILKQVEVAA